QLRDRLVPTDRLELTGAARAFALQRLRDAIGVIRDLDRRLPARAQSAAADGILRQPFDLLRDVRADDAALAVSNGLDVGVHHARVDGASGAAHRADARLPCRDPGNDVFLGNEADQLMLRVAAARERRARTGDRRQLDEIASVHRSPRSPERLALQLHSLKGSRTNCTCSASLLGERY